MNSLFLASLGVLRFIGYRVGLIWAHMQREKRQQTTHHVYEVE